MKRKEFRSYYGFDNSFVVGSVGKLNISKNHSYLLKIFANLKKKFDINYEAYKLEKMYLEAME